jgi:hypothetical protein
MKCPYRLRLSATILSGSVASKKRPPPSLKLSEPGGRKRRAMASIPADHTELPCVVTQRGMSGRLRSVDEHYRFEETSIRCPENAAASLPFALCASLAAAVRRWLKMGGSWPSSQIHRTRQARHCVPKVEPHRNSSRQPIACSTRCAAPVRKVTPIRVGSVSPGKRHSTRLRQRCAASPQRAGEKRSPSPLPHHQGQRSPTRPLGSIG